MPGLLVLFECSSVMLSVLGTGVPLLLSLFFLFLTTLLYY
jgi:hypothetical protein